MPRRLTPPDPPLAAAGIRLEPLAQRDHADAWAMVQAPDVKRFTYLPSDADEAFVTRWLARYENAWLDASAAGFSVRDSQMDAFLGFAAIVRLDLEGRQGEIGYMLGLEARGRGAAATAVDLLTCWGFDELGLLRLELRIDDTNDPSKRVAERAGYRLEGVLRSLAFKEGLRTDTGVWSRLPSDRLSV